MLVRVRIGVASNKHNWSLPKVPRNLDDTVIFANTLVFVVLMFVDLHVKFKNMYIKMNYQGKNRKYRNKKNIFLNYI